MTDNNKMQANLVDDNKIKANLTDKWKKGKLEEYKRYYCKTVRFEDMFMARCHNKGQNDEWWTLENEKYSYNNVHHIKDIEVLAPVPSYEEWQASEKYNKHLEEVIKIYERKDKQATETSIAYNELAKENAILKELMKDCRLAIFDYPPYDLASDKVRLTNKIDEVLK